jgi:DinB superfamily
MDVRDRIAEWSRRSRAARLTRLAATPSDLTARLSAARAGVLARRPGPVAWAPVEVICHLRDLEESFYERLALILTSDDPCFPATDPNRWAGERQYLRNDVHAAARAFARRRGETLDLLGGVGPGDWSRAGRQLDSRGRRTADDFLTLMAWHDENHLEQLDRALDGRA